MAATPTAVLISRSFDLPWDARLFEAADQPVIVYTGASGEPPEVAAPLEVVRLDDPRPRAVMADLRARGVRTLLCEGGPTLNSALLEADVVDELFLTISPLLAGRGRGAADRRGRGAARRRPAGARVGAAPRRASSTCATGCGDERRRRSGARRSWRASGWRRCAERPVRAAGEPDGLRGAAARARRGRRSPSSRRSPRPPSPASSRAPARATSASSPAARCRPRSRADWLTSAWDQNAGLHVMSPAAAAAEETVAGWAKELLGLPAGAGVGFVTGAQMANVDRARRRAQRGPRARRLGRRGARPDRRAAAARDHERRVARDGVQRAAAARPRARHGAARRRRRPGPDARRTRSPPRWRAGAGPAIVCAQAGNVNTGAFDPFEDDRRRVPRSTARGATSTARSGSGPPPRPAART